MSLANRRLESKEEELQELRLAHTRKEREWADREAVLEGRLTIAEQELSKHTSTAAAAASAAGRKPPPIPTSPNGANQNNRGGATPTTVTPQLPLRPLLPYAEDSPFYRREEHMFATKVNNLSTRLKRIVVKAKEFSQATSKFAETAHLLSSELSAPWGEVEGGLDAILASAIQLQASQAGLPQPDEHTAPNQPGHKSTRSSIIQTEELVSLSSAFGKLGAMLSTVCDIGTNLSVNVDAFLVSALVDFRQKHIQSVLEKEVLLKKAQEDYETAIVKRLNKKRERSMLSGLTGIVTEKQKKKQQQEEEEIRSQILVCSSLRKTYELLRFDYVSLLNEVLLERRMELIEMVSAGFWGFKTYFHEGSYMSETIKVQIDQITKHINMKRPLYHANNDGIREQRVTVEKALELVIGAGSSSTSQSTPTSNNFTIEKVLNWRVKDAFPSSSTASGLMSPAAQTQQEQRLVLVTPATPTTAATASLTKIPSPYAHALIRGKMVPIEREGYLRKQSSSMNKSWKQRWFILQDGQLFYVRDASDINPVHVQAVLLCTVRISQKSDYDHCFDLISPNKRVYTLQAETEESMKAWMEVFQNVRRR